MMTTSVRTMNILTGGSRSLRRLTASQTRGPVAPLQLQLPLPLALLPCYSQSVSRLHSMPAIFLPTRNFAIQDRSGAMPVSTATPRRLFYPAAATQQQQPPNPNPNPQPAEEEEQEKPPRGEGTIARLTREYGRIAVFVYTTLTFTVFVCCYLAIASFGVDVHDVLEKFHGLREVFGWNTTDADREQATQAKQNQDDSEKVKPPFFSWTNWLLALALTKVFVPVKLLLTTAITPTVARILRARGWEVGTKAIRDIRPKPGDD